MKLSKLVDLPSSIKQLIDKALWPELLATGSVAVYERDEYMVITGERDSYVRVGLSGWIAIQRSDTILGITSTGVQTNAIGVDPAPATADLVALTEVTVVLLDRVKFTDALLNSEPTGLLTVLIWSQRHLDMICTLFAMQSASLNIRLATLLWTMGESIEDGRRKLPSAIPQRILARALGVTREEVNRKKRQLIDIGCLIEDGENEYMNMTAPLLWSSLW